MPPIRIYYYHYYFKVTFLYKPNGFLRSPRHIFIASFVLNYCVLRQIKKKKSEKCGEEDAVNILARTRISMDDSPSR